MNKEKTINTPKDAVKIAKSVMLDKNKENFIGIYLSACNQVNKVELISLGIVNMTIVHPRETFRPAIITHSVSIIVLHNHMSKNMEPSEADISVTKRLTDAGDLLGIELLDHIIFGSDQNYNSIKDKKTF